MTYDPAEFAQARAFDLANNIPEHKEGQGPHLLTAIVSGQQDWCGGVGSCTICNRLEPFIDHIYMLLADASQGTVDPSRAREIAQRAVLEATDNREGK